MKHSIALGMALGLIVIAWQAGRGANRSQIDSPLPSSSHAPST